MGASGDDMETQLKDQDRQMEHEGGSGWEDMTPEEEAKSKAFFAWLEATACQLDLDANEQSKLKELYDRVVCLRPYHSIETLDAAQEAVTQWAGSHPTDPLNSTLHNYVEARRKEAQLWSDLNIRLATS